MSLEELIRHVSREPEVEWAEPEIRNPEFHQAFLKHCVSVVDSNPRDGQRLAELAVRLACEPCGESRAWGLVAHTQQVLGDLNLAEASLETAFRLGEACRSGACPPDNTRRRAILRLYQRRFSDAFDQATEAIELYRGLGHPGHDLHGNGLASSLNIRGIVAYHLGDISGSTNDLSQALDLLSPEESPALYRMCIFNLASTLQASSRREDLLMADQYLTRARRLFRGAKSSTQEHAKLAWLTAMVRHELGKIRPVRVRDMLEGAQQDFLGLGLIAEAVAVTADLARIVFPDRFLIRQLVESVAMRSKEVLQETRPEIWEKLGQVRTAVETSGWDAVDILRESLEGLRTACGSDMIACLIQWREA